MTTRTPENPDRKATDESLDAERDRSDEELARRSQRVEHEVDRNVWDARRQADTEVEQARATEDRERPEDGAQRADVHEERAAADTRVRHERAVADEQLTADREARRRAVAAVLTEERERTDRHLSDERERAGVGRHDEFLHVVSRDLRDLIGTILLSVSAIRSLDESAGRHGGIVVAADRIERAAHRMDRLVRDLSDVPALAAGRVVDAALTTDPLALLCETRDTLAPLAAQKRVTIDVDAPSRTPAAWCDRDRILHVLATLVRNAIEFSSEGARIVLALAADRWGLRFTVTDSGCGIAPDRIGGIFDGLGTVRFGLSIARRIVEAHGGAIGVTSRPGDGCTFWFTLPSGPTRP